jgi:hypothetical protein
MTRLLIPVLIALAGCGVDGPPIPPSEAREGEEPTPRGSILISGSVSAGIVGGSAN